jgi:hypothetical protein
VGRPTEHPSPVNLPDGLLRAVPGTEIALVLGALDRRFDDAPDR